MVYLSNKLNEIHETLKPGQYLTVDYPETVKSGEEDVCWAYVFEFGSMLVAEYRVTLTHEEIVNFLGNDQ